MPVVTEMQLRQFIDRLMNLSTDKKYPYWFEYQYEFAKLNQIVNFYYSHGGK